jgi:16S rRNA (uracil1498-N3)-methyltransferase
VAHFYLVDDLSDALVGSTVVVEGQEARHAVTVSRVRVGEPLSLGDGRGTSVRGEVVEATDSRLALVAAEVTRVERPATRLVLVQALAKGDRDELAVQAATELGVDEVVPWAAARSVSRWEGAKIAKGTTRWRSITREATKQAIRPWAPEVTDLLSTKQLVARAAVGVELVLVLEPTARRALSEVELRLGRAGADAGAEAGGDADAGAEAGAGPRAGVGGAPSSVLVVVGPEGGISPSELEQLEAAGAVMVRLGDSVLRTSTAGPAALAVLSVRLRRW